MAVCRFGDLAGGGFNGGRELLTGRFQIGETSTYVVARERSVWAEI